jgi:hypothetical protein
MADIDFDLDEGQQEVNKTELRIKNLSEKVKLTSEERDELAKAKDTLEQEKASISKDLDFYKGFSALTAKYTGAAEYQDKILEKVRAGYDVEDATVSVLAKENKLNATASEPLAPKESPAGGSATNAIKAGGEKSLSEMSKEEKREALMKSEGEVLAIFQQ